MQPFLTHESLSIYWKPYIYIDLYSLTTYFEGKINLWQHFVLVVHITNNEKLFAHFRSITKKKSSADAQQPQWTWGLHYSLSVFLYCLLVMQFNTRLIWKVYSQQKCFFWQSLMQILCWNTQWKNLPTDFPIMQRLCENSGQHITQPHCLPNV